MPNVGVIDAGLPISWMRAHHPRLRQMERLFSASKSGNLDLVISVVNLAEVLIHTVDIRRKAGVDAVALLLASRVRIHHPDEETARRVAVLSTSLAGGFAVATAQQLGARLHTTDRALVRQIRSTRIPVTQY